MASEFEEIANDIGLRPTKESLESLRRMNMIQNYEICPDGFIKVQPYFPAKWIEKMPEWDYWIERTV